MKVKDVKESGVYETGVLFVKRPFFIDEQVFVRAERRDEPGELQYLGEIAFHGRGDGRRGSRHLMAVSCDFQIGSDPVDIGCVIERPVIAVLVL